MEKKISQLPEDIKHTILYKIGIYKLKYIFAKNTLYKHIISKIYKYKCSECKTPMKQKRKYPTCAESALGLYTCCFKIICMSCDSLLPLSCGHCMDENLYVPYTTNAMYGCFNIEQTCPVCNENVRVIRPWYGMTPEEWESRYG